MNLTALDLMVSESIHPLIQAQTGYTQARRYHFINRGYYKFVTANKCIEADISITTVADQAYYTSTDAANLAFLYQPYEVRYIDSGSSDVGWPLKPYPGGHKKLPRVKSYARPTHYWTQFTNVQDDVRFGTWPINNVSSDTIVVSSYLFPTSELSQGAHIPVIKEFAHDALSYYAISEIHRIFSYLSSSFDKIKKEYMGYFIDKVNEYNHFLYGDSADELPQFIVDDGEDIYDVL